MIKFNNVSKVYYGKKTALQGINFSLPKGSLTYLMGHSGAGKSTLLKLIMGMEKANGGQILFNDYDITRLPQREMPFLRHQIGMIHQDDYLLNNESVLNNVALPLIIAGISRKEAQKKARESLEKVSLKGYEHYFPSALSGGERQRVDIARAIVHKPQILLADEPTGNLDQRLSREIFQLFSQFHQQGMTVLIATHDLDVLKQRPFHCLNLHQGRLV